MGIYSLLVGIGFVAAFPLVGQTVLGAGWRTAWSAVGVVLLVVVAPLAWLVVRDPDGQAGQAGSARGHSEPSASEASDQRQFALGAGPQRQCKEDGQAGELLDVEGLATEPSDLTIRQAIGLAGGFTEDASTGSARLVREVNGATRTFKVKLEDHLQAGDTIVVKAKLF